MCSERSPLEQQTSSDVFFFVEMPDLMTGTTHDLAVHAMTVMAHITTCACTARSCVVPFIRSVFSTKENAHMSACLSSGDRAENFSSTPLRSQVAARVFFYFYAKKLKYFLRSFERAAVCSERSPLERQTSSRWFFLLRYRT